MATNLMIEPLTEEAFAEYGEILGIPENDPPTVSFGKRQNSYLNIVDMNGFESDRTTFGIVQGFHAELKLDQIERHFLSAEAFIPLKGVSVLFRSFTRHVNTLAWNRISMMTQRRTSWIALKASRLRSNLCGKPKTTGLHVSMKRN